MNQKTDNIYIDGLSFGVKHMEEGISFNELTEHLNSIGWKIESTQMEYFRYWFFSNFYYVHAYTIIKNGNHLQLHNLIKDSAQWLDLKCPMTAEGYDLYLDHMKLKRAQDDSKKSLNMSIVAIVISGILALIQIILQLTDCK